MIDGATAAIAPEYWSGIFFNVQAVDDFMGYLVPANDDGWRVLPEEEIAWMIRG